MSKTLPAPAGGVRLSEFFETHFLPKKLVRRGVAESTIEEFRLALRRWIDVAGDPPLNQITEQGNQAFVDKLLSSTGRSGKPLSAVTARKHCRRIDAIISAADWADRAQLYALIRSEIETRKMAREKTRKRLNAHKSPPAIPKPDLPDEPDEEKLLPQFSPDEIARFFDACGRTREPSKIGIPVGDFWRCLFALLWNTGLRIGDALAARRSLIRSDDEGTWLRLNRSARRFTYDSQLIPKRPAEVFLNAQARDVVARLNSPAAADDDRIIRWPFSADFLRTIWREILACCEIAPERRRELGFDAACARNVFGLRFLKCGFPNLPPLITTSRDYYRRMAEMYSAIPPLQLDQAALPFGDARTPDEPPTE